ncbi:hypothetical protein F7725_010824 [Dissostichus mawsoni]|uniref:Ig-like domain-containing protein n=1 Tax=Dissostichus mawsoni TaxID=36200 RepID=A0A7J5Z7W2_DISMA|nr:hypothetical protein F7725_010824 [Dissostichus mawsoni]
MTLCRLSIIPSSPCSFSWFQRHSDRYRSAWEHRRDVSGAVDHLGVGVVQEQDEARQAALVLDDGPAVHGRFSIKASDWMNSNHVIRLTNQLLCSPELKDPRPPTVTGNTKPLYRNLWSEDNTILINIKHKRQNKRMDLQCKGVDTVTQPAGDVRATEGDTVTLGCKFQTSTTAYLFWYKQEVNGYPKYMLRRYSGGGDNAAESRKTDLMLHSTISSAAVTDSAVYYCALKPTVTGNTTTLAQRDNVLQPEAEKTATKGEAVTLGCHYNTTSTNDYLFWYKQHGDNSPTFILSRFKIGTGKTEDEDRFSSTLDSSLRSVPLKIQKLQLSDSAVYYCALQPTVTGNTNTLYKNLWSKDNTILHNIHQREPLSTN